MRAADHGLAHIGKLGNEDIAPASTDPRLPADPYHSSLAISSAAIGA